MEGNQVGKTDATAPTRAADFDLSDLLWPSTDLTGSPINPATNSPADPSDELVWPTNFSETNASSAGSSQDSPKPQPKIASVLAVGVFVIAALFAFALGPVQLILLATTQDYDFVTATYYPTALRLTLLSSGIFMFVNIIALVLSRRSDKHHALIASTLCAGSITLFAVAWLAAFVVEFQPNQLAIIILPLILLFWFAALMASKTFATESEPGRALQVFMIILMLCSGTEIIFDGIYMFSKTAPEEPSVDLARLIQDAAAAQLEPIPEQLSKFVFTLCDGPYEIVFYDEAHPLTGLFECQASHEVYSVADPEISQDSDRFARATYLGQTYQADIESILPDAKYLYRNLSAFDPELPNELILLLASGSEEALVDENLNALTELANLEPNLNLSIFYTDPLDDELTTRDYILTTAVGTIALADWLPHGTVFVGADTPTEALRYNFSLDRALQALSTLGMDPSAYSSQVRDAITSRQHIQTNTSELDFANPEVLREQLLASFVSNNSNN